MYDLVVRLKNVGDVWPRISRPVIKRTRRPKRRVRKVKVKFPWVGYRNWNQGRPWGFSGTAYRYIQGVTATVSKAPSLHSTSICLQRTMPRHHDNTQLCYLINQAGTQQLERQQLKPLRSTANSCTFVKREKKKRQSQGHLQIALAVNYIIPTTSAVATFTKHLPVYFATKTYCRIFCYQISQHGLFSTAD